MDEELSKILKIEDETDRDLALLEPIKQAADAQDLGKVLEIQGYISGSYEKALAFIEAACVFGQTRNIKIALDLFDRAVTSALLTDEAWQKAELLAKVGKGLASLNKLGAATRIWFIAVDIAQNGKSDFGPQNAADCDSVLGEIAQYQHEAGLIEEAQRTIEKISSPGKRDSVRSRIK